MHDPNAMPGQPLDLEAARKDSRLLRWALTGGSTDGDAASAIYGTILAASILIIDFGGPWSIFLTIVGTGIVFWLAHAHVALMRTIIRNGEHVDRTAIRRTLIEEWPLAQASLSPAAPMLLAALGVIGETLALELGLLICFVGLIAWGLVIARAAGFTRRQTIFAVSINVGLGLLMILLKALLH